MILLILVLVFLLFFGVSIGWMMCPQEYYRRLMLWFSRPKEREALVREERNYIELREEKENAASAATQRGYHETAARGLAERAVAAQLMEEASAQAGVALASCRCEEAKMAKAERRKAEKAEAREGNKAAAAAAKRKTEESKAETAKWEQRLVEAKAVQAEHDAAAAEHDAAAAAAKRELQEAKVEAVSFKLLRAKLVAEAEMAKIQLAKVEAEVKARAANVQVAQAEAEALAEAKAEAEAAAFAFVNEELVVARAQVAHVKVEAEKAKADAVLRESSAHISGHLRALGLNLPEVLHCFDSKQSRLYKSGVRTRDIQSLAGPGEIQVHWVGRSKGVGHEHHPYFCPPDGWIKFGVRIERFEDYQHWPIVYHGTKREHVERILNTGLKAGPRAAHGRAVYVSPSIIYSSHEMYAEWWKPPGSSDEVQTVLMCRVHPACFTRKENVMVRLVGRHKVPLFTNQDPNWDDKEIVWPIQPDLPNGEVSSSKLIITGVMYRRK